MLDLELTTADQGRRQKQGWLDQPCKSLQARGLTEGNIQYSKPA